MNWLGYWIPKTVFRIIFPGGDKYLKLQGIPFLTQIPNYFTSFNELATPGS